MTKNIKHGKVIVPGGIHPWQHEIKVAQLLADAGYNVEFIPEQNLLKTADFKINGIEFELKSPEGRKLSAVERNLRRALKQSPNIVFDSSRMSGLHDEKILKCILHHAHKQSLIQRLIFLDKHGRIKVFSFK